MVTLLGTSEVSGVSGDDERESIVTAVVIDIDGDGEHERRAQRRACRTAGDTTPRPETGKVQRVIYT